MSEENPKNIPVLTQGLDIDTVLNNPSVLKLYGNGFTVGHSLSDASVLIQVGKAPIAVLILPQ